MEGTTLSISSSEVWYGRIQGSNVTFENIHFTSNVGATGQVTYKNCTFDGWTICASSNNEKTYLEDCTIGELIFWDMSTVLENCTVETLDDSHMKNNQIIVK